MRFTKLIATALALAAFMTSFVSTADAGRRHYYGHGGYYNHGYGGAFAAGALGFAAGALLGGAFAGPYGYHPYYYNGYAPRYYYAPRVYYRHAPRYYDDYYYGGPCDLPAGQVSRPAWAMC